MNEADEHLKVFAGVDPFRTDNTLFFHLTSGRTSLPPSSCCLVTTATFNSRREEKDDGLHVICSYRVSSAVCSEWYLIPSIALNSQHTSDLPLYGSLWQSPQRNTSQLHSSAYLPPDGSAGPWGLCFFVLLFLNSKGRCTAELRAYICVTGGTTLGLVIQTGLLHVFVPVSSFIRPNDSDFSHCIFFGKIHVLMLDMTPVGWRCDQRNIAQQPRAVGNSLKRKLFR